MIFGSVTNCFNEEALIGGFLNLMDVDYRIVIISNQTYQGNRIKHDRSEEIAVAKGAIVIRCDTSDQNEMRNLGLNLLQCMGVHYAFIADVDEWYPAETLKNYKQYIKNYPGIAYKTNMIYLFKKPQWQALTPNDTGTKICVRTDKRNIRFKDGIPEGDTVEIPSQLGRVYHLSYLRSVKKMREKLANFSHAKEVRENWLEDYFINFKPDMKNFGSTAPWDFTEIKKIEVPDDIIKNL